MARHLVEVAVEGPRSLATSRAFWAGFTPSALPQCEGEAPQSAFLVESEWRRASVSVTQRGAAAVLELTGEGDLDLAAAQVCRFLSLDGLLDAVTLRSMLPAAAVPAVQQVKGLGPFAAELVVLRGANAPDAVPHNESRLTDEVRERYGRPVAEVSEVSEAWRPYRTWASVYLRVLRERRLGGAMAVSGG